MMMLNSWLLKKTQPGRRRRSRTSARMMRVRSSSRCSRKDMRSMPRSSPSSSSSSGGGGGGGAARTAAPNRQRRRSNDLRRRRRVRVVAKRIGLIRRQFSAVSFVHLNTCTSTSCRLTNFVAGPARWIPSGGPCPSTGGSAARPRYRGFGWSHVIRRPILQKRLPWKGLVAAGASITAGVVDYNASSSYGS